MNIYFTSDTHYAHKNIVRGTSSWSEDGSSHSGQNTRNFDTLEEHNAAIVKGINDIVGPDDVLWHLGDWSFGGFDKIKIFRDQLICQNIHLVFGNHDEQKPRSEHKGGEILHTDPEIDYIVERGDNPLSDYFYDHGLINRESIIILINW